MTKFDPETITPPSEWVERLFVRFGTSWEDDATEMYRAGAQAAVDALKHRWPEPITDRPPTDADLDEEGNVQVLFDGHWELWGICSARDYPWLHTPRYQPKPPPTLREQALASIAEQLKPGDFCRSRSAMMAALELAQKALTEQGGEPQP